MPPALRLDDCHACKPAGKYQENIMATLRQSKMVRVAFMAVLATVFVSATATAVRAAGDPPPDFAKLQKDLKQAYDAGNYQKALETAEKMHELKPDDIETLYNIACMHCLLGHKEKAYEWLEKTIEAGYKDADWLANDDDFKTIRGEDHFRDLLKQIREGGKKGAAKKDSEVKKEAKKEAKQDEGQKDKEKQEKKDQAKKDVEKKDVEKKEQPKQAPQPQKQAKPGKFQLSDQEKAARVQELTQAAIAASEKKDRYKALALTLEARVLADVGLTNYNVACMYSLLDQKDDAFRYLDRAVELDQMPTPMVQQMEGDTDLDNIRKDPRYAELLKRAGGDKSDAKPAPDQQGKKVDPEWQVTVPKDLDKSKKAPLIVALHGYNGSMDQTIKQWKEAAAEVGAILLTPQGTFCLSDDHYQWGRDIDAIEENIMAAIDEAMEDHQIDKKKVIIVGFSQGGWAAWSVALRNPDVFRGAIPVAGRPADNWKDDVEEDGVKKLRIYAMLGADDEERLLKDNKQTAQQLKEMGAKVEVRTFDGVGHDFPKNSKEEEVKALKFVLES
jgi:predicted esterase